MDPQIIRTQHWFRQIYLSGIPELLRRNETAFLSFLCCVAAVDALAGYRYVDSVGTRFESFVRDYFPASYALHAANLYRFRCRMLHNFSPAHFTLTHANPNQHLQTSQIGDIVLSDESFFSDIRFATERYFAELEATPLLQSNMLARLRNLEAGGGIDVI